MITIRSKVAKNGKVVFRVNRMGIYRWSESKIEAMKWAIVPWKCNKRIQLKDYTY